MNTILSQIFALWNSLFGFQTIHHGQFSSYQQRPVMLYTVLREKRHTVRAKFLRRFVDSGADKIELLSPAIALIQFDYIDSASNFDVARDAVRSLYDYLITENFGNFMQDLDSAFLVVSPIRELSERLPGEFEFRVSFDAELRYADLRTYDSLGVIDTVDNIIFEEA